MAIAGNESDLVVRISVDSTQVREGFEEILSEARAFMGRMRSTLDFSRLFDSTAMARTLTDKIEHSVDEALGRVSHKTIELDVSIDSARIEGEVRRGTESVVEDAVRSLSDLEARAAAVMAPSATPTPGVVASAPTTSAATSAARAEAEELRKRNAIIREYISLLGKIRSTETKMGVAEYRMGKYGDMPGGEVARAAFAREYEELSALAESLRGRLAAISAAHAGEAWFDSDEMKRTAELSDAVAKAEAEARIEASKVLDIKRKQEEAERRLVKAYAASLYVYRLTMRLLREFVSVAKSFISVADEIYQAQLKLGAAMKVNSDSTASSVRSMYSYIQALSEANGLSVSVNYSAAQILASYVGTEESLKGLLKAYDDLAIKMKGYNINAQSATTLAKQLARALAGDTTALSKYGFVISEAEKKILKDSSVSNAAKVQVLIDAIARRTGDLSRESETWAGMVNRIKVQGQLIKYNFGMALENALKPMLNIVLGIANALEGASQYAYELSKFMFGDNIKGAEEMSSALSDLNDELDEAQSHLLSFDKFNVLSNDSALANAINAAFGSESSDTSSDGEKRNDELERWVELIGNATGASQGLKAVLTGIAVTLGGIVATVGVLAAMTMAKKIKDMAVSLGVLNGSLNVTKLGVAKLAIGVTLLVAGIMTLTEGISKLKEWNDLTWQERTVAIIKIATGAFMTLGGVVLVVKTLFKDFGLTMTTVKLKMASFVAANNTLAGSFTALATSVAAFAAATAGIIVFISSIEKMGGTASVIVGVTSAMIALAAAIIAVEVADAGWLAAVKAAAIAGGIALAVGSMIATTTVTKHANGGMPDRGQLFIANEAGPELVGNIGGHTSVANNEMITRALEEAAYRGMVRASQEGGANNVTLTLHGDGVRNDALVRALMPALKTEIRRQGGVKKAFGED